MGRPSEQQDQPDPRAPHGTLSAYYMPGLGWAQGIQGEEHKLCHNGTNMELGKRITEVERWWYLLYLWGSRMVSLVKYDI